MPTTIDTYLPFDSGAGSAVTENSWREMAKHFLGSASGVIRGYDSDFSTIGDSSGMNIKVASGQCWMRGHYGRNASTRTIAIAAAHATLARKDAAILRADFVNNRIEIDVLTGTASGSPVRPSLTQNTSVWETLLAEVNVPAAAATITAGNVLDYRYFTTVVAKYSRSTTLLVPTSGTSTVDVAFDTVEVGTGEVVRNATNDQFTLNRSGIWSLTSTCGFSPTASGARRLLITNTANNSFTRTDNNNIGASENCYLVVSTVEKFTAGQILKVRVWQNGASACNTIAGDLTFSATWIGP
jgi:hypothetical protein